MCNSLVSLYFIRAIVLKTLDSLDQDLLAHSLLSSFVSIVSTFECVKVLLTTLDPLDIESILYYKLAHLSLLVLCNSGEFTLM